MRGSFREGLQHVMTFNAQNLAHLVERHGFRVEEAGTCHQAESDTGSFVFTLGKKVFERYPKLGGTLFFVLAPN
jgi:hypothetical protein